MTKVQITSSNFAKDNAESVIYQAEQLTSTLISTKETPGTTAINADSEDGLWNIAIAKPIGNAVVINPDGTECIEEFFEGGVTQRELQTRLDALSTKTLTQYERDFDPCDICLNELDPTVAHIPECTHFFSPTLPKKVVNVEGDMPKVRNTGKNIP